MSNGPGLIPPAIGAAVAFIGLGQQTG